MIILAIETSCDETAAAIVKFSKNKAEVLANVVSSQVKAHSKFGGVVPSLASRMHLKNMVPVLKRVFWQAEKHTLTPLPGKMGRGKRGISIAGLPRSRPVGVSASGLWREISLYSLSRQSPLMRDSDGAGIYLKASELSSFGNLIDYIAITNGPGLIPALMIGTQAAKTLSYALNKPLVPINHIEGHIYANWLRPKLEIGNWKLEDSKKLSLRGSSEPKQSQCYARGTDAYEIPAILTPGLLRRSAPRNDIYSYDLWTPKFPILCLIVSGGHTQLVLMKKDLDYEIVGETLDDAAGEAFDKVAKLLELGYPGGPKIEKMARKGDGNKFKFPRPMMNSKDYNFSFSGLKTAVMYKWKMECGMWNVENREKNTKLQGFDADFSSARLQKPPSPPYQGGCSMPKLPITNYQLQYKSDIAASFQQAVIDVLVSKTIAAAKKYKAKNIILGGGVSANKELQKKLGEAINKELPITNYQLPITNLSTDNALMIAVAGYYHILNNKNISSWKNVEADANLVLSS